MVSHVQAVKAGSVTLNMNNMGMRGTATLFGQVLVIMILSCPRSHMCACHERTGKNAVEILWLCRVV